MKKMEKIPYELMRKHQWVCWTKQGKIPINPNTGKASKTNDCLTWGSFETANKYWEANQEKLGGIGFVFTEDDPYVGIDLDDCFRDDGTLKDWAISGVSQFKDTYMEVSPSGTGLHIILKGVLPDGKAVKTQGIEVYDRLRYFTMTGETWGYNANPFDDDTLITDCQYTLNALVEKLKKQPVPGKAKSLASQWSSGREGVDEGFRNHNMMKMIGRMVKDGYNDDEIIAEVNATNQNRNNPPDPKMTRELIQDRLIYVREKEDARGNGQILTFPDIMDGVAGMFAKTYSDHLEPPPHFFFIGFLTALGVLLSGNVTLASEIEPDPRLYAILLGESADDRKSTALTKVTRLFKDALQMGFPVSWGVGSAEGLQQYFKDSDRLLLILDEFKQFISKASIDASVLLPCVNTLFENTWYNNRTKTSNVNIDPARLSLLGASTLDTYEKAWTSSFTDIGFNNRLFIVSGTGERKNPIPREVPEEVVIKMKMEIGKLLKFAKDVHKLKVTPEAEKLYGEWYFNRESSVHSKRLDVYALRFMILLAVNEYLGEITEEIVDRVTRLMDWQLEMRRQHDPIDAENKMAMMEEKIRRAVTSNGGISRRDLMKKVHYERYGLWFFDTALKNLERGRQIYLDKVSKCYRDTRDKG